MVTATQTTAFFQEPEQMGIPAATAAQLALEGMDTVESLADFDTETLAQLASNLRRPGGRVPDPDPGAAPGATIPTPAFVFGAKSQKRLSVMCDLMRYYQATGRPATVTNIRWNPYGINFEHQWKAIKDQKKKDVKSEDIPVISKSLPVLKWLEAFDDFLSSVIGSRMCALSYVTREDAAVPAAAPPLAHNMPHSTEHGSVQDEMVARISHNHPIYPADNKQVYLYLEKATRGSAVAATLKVFQATKNGRGALIAIRSQHAGDDKWDKLIREADELIHNRVWKGLNNFTLESFIQQHRQSFVDMQMASQHVQYQLPNDHTRVGYLLDAIKSTDPGLQAAMAQIRSNDVTRANFEEAVSYLLPYDPVVAKRKAKRGSGQISSAEVGSTDADKPTGIGPKTGVHLRFYEEEEYHQLSTEQQDELRQWRIDLRAKGKDPNGKKGKGKGGKGGKGKRTNAKWSKKQISSLIDKRLKKQLDQAVSSADANMEDAKPEANVEAMISKAISSAVAKAMNTKIPAKKVTISATNSTPAQKPEAKPPVTIQSILRAARNGKGNE